MLVKSFGEPFIMAYYPMVDGMQISPPAQAPSIYIFEHNPSPSDIDDGASALGSEITLWGEDKDYVRSISIPAIADDAGSTDTKNYWIGLKYIAAQGGSHTYDILQFRLERPDGKLTTAMPTVAELHSREATLETYYKDESDIENYVRSAHIITKSHFRALGVDWADIENPEDIKEVVIYMALAKLFQNRRREEGDTFDIKFIHYLQLAQDLLGQLKIEHDADSNNEVTDMESTTNTRPTSWFR